MATLRMQANEPNVGRISSERQPESVDSDPTAPGGRNFWRARLERLLLMFAVATVMTVPSLAILFVGWYLESTLVTLVGNILLLIAMIAWWVVYFVVTRWFLLNAIATIRRLRSRPRE